MVSDKRLPTGHHRTPYWRTTIWKIKANTILCMLKQGCTHSPSSGKCETIEAFSAVSFFCLATCGVSCFWISNTSPGRSRLTGDTFRHWIGAEGADFGDASENVRLVLTLPGVIWLFSFSKCPLNSGNGLWGKEQHQENIVLLMNMSQE